MGTSGRLIPKPDCRVKTLSFAGPGNVKKTDEKKWKSNQDLFRTKLTQGADKSAGHHRKTDKRLQGEPMGTLLQPRRRCWAKLQKPPALPKSSVPQPRQTLWGSGGAVIPLGPAVASLHQLCSLSLTSSTVCCPPLDTASTCRFSSCFPVISTGLQTSSSSPVPSW